MEITYHHKLEIEQIRTVSIAFPVLSSFKAGPFMSVSRKKCLPLTASFMEMSLSSCNFYKSDILIVQ